MGSRETHKWMDGHISRTTIHGLRQVGRSKSHNCIRLFWLVVLMISLSGLCFSLYNLIMDYEQYRMNVDITITEEQMKFPAVTFCNINPYKQSLLQYISSAQAALTAFGAASQAAAKG